MSAVCVPFHHVPFALSFFGSLEKSLGGIIILKKDSEWGKRRVKKIQPRAYLELALQLRGLIKSVGNDSDLHHYAKRIMCHSTHSVWAASSVWGRNPRTWRSLRPGAPQEKVPLLPFLRLILWLSEWGCGEVLMPAYLFLRQAGCLFSTGWTNLGWIIHSKHALFHQGSLLPEKIRFIYSVVTEEMELAGGYLEIPLKVKIYDTG